jgi:signal transduction histidine kinase
VERALAQPLASWRLRYFPAPGELDRALEGSARRATWAGLLAVLLAVLGLAAYFLRESARELREARQRLSFVNQVSHELKTPLTNIRMYAELLEESLDEESVTEREHAAVIVSESQRLSRLIANVLSFGRQQRGKLVVRRSVGELDAAIRQLVEQFRPVFRERGLEVELDLRAAGASRFDADALGQIMGNLLSNVEKYAAGGKRVHIASERDGATARIRVTDGGPGIPARSRDDVFLPFVRLSGAVTDGVAGTGIGLSIARELARLHGGDLRLEPSTAGACFVVELAAPPVTDPEDAEPSSDERSVP